ncbi:MAG: Sec-independent protein translocase protein TatB [Inquilinaceae bacterium]
MLDIGWPEFALILVVALLVIGPKDLPKALYTVGKWVRKARAVTGDFQRHIDTMVRDAELEDARKGLQQASNFSIKREIERSVDPDGSLSKSLRSPNDPTAGSSPVKQAAVAGPAENVKPAAGQEPMGSKAAGPKAAGTKATETKAGPSAKSNGSTATADPASVGPAAESPSGTRPTPSKAKTAKPRRPASKKAKPSATVPGDPA